MLVDHKFKWGAEIVLLAAIVLEPGADAITADVAKKCQSGNPAAGSSKGSAKDQRDYFKKCVDNGGNMDGAAENKAGAGDKK
jgi:hypothetical protein